MASLCHSGFTTTNLSYRFPIFEASAPALCGTTGSYCYRDYNEFLVSLLRYFIPCHKDQNEGIPHSYRCEYCISGVHPVGNLSAPWPGICRGFLWMAPPNHPILIGFSWIFHYEPLFHHFRNPPHTRSASCKSPGAPRKFWICLFQVGNPSDTASNRAFSFENRVRFWCSPASLPRSSFYPWDQWPEMLPSKATF